MGKPGGGTSRVAGVMHERCGIDMGVGNRRGEIHSGGRGYRTYEALSFKAEWATHCHPWARLPRMWPERAMNLLVRYAQKRLSEADGGDAGVKGWAGWAFACRQTVPRDWRLVIVERDVEETVRRYARREEGYKRWQDADYRDKVRQFIRLQHTLVETVKACAPARQQVVISHHDHSDAEVERLIKKAR